ncbi:hypothetical protein EPR50_G00029710 [Perca flavescens]|uniref:Uncharacterized protein n=1 Tax=Perca flavescens TaxID=8167 RepID=A0A484DI72_PERFV|nr:hypothetical protein EPR50_G00029710 [Perca flavescens]
MQNSTHSATASAVCRPNDPSLLRTIRSIRPHGAGDSTPVVQQGARSMLCSQQTTIKGGNLITLQFLFPIPPPKLPLW